jgi:hypothetical protein
MSNLSVDIVITRIARNGDNLLQTRRRVEDKPGERSEMP